MLSPRYYLGVVLAVLASMQLASAQTPQQLQKQINDLTGRVGKVETAVKALTTQPSTPTPIPVPVPLPTVWPVAEASPVYAPVKTYCVSVAGQDTDTNDGSMTRPFKTGSFAVVHVTQDRSRGFTGLIEIAYDGQGKTTNDPNQAVYDQNLGLRGGNVLLDSYNGIAKVTSGNGLAFFILGNTPNNTYFFQNLDIIAPATLPSSWTYGIYAQGGIDDVQISRCRISGWTFNIGFLGGKRLKIWNNYLSDAWAMTGSMGGSGVFVSWAEHPDIQGNFVFNNGFDPKQYTPAWYSVVTGVGSPSANALLQNLMFFHGAYMRLEVEGDSHQDRTLATGVSRCNFYGNSGCTGLQMRIGGEVAGDVYFNNGNATDVFVDNQVGELHHCAVFAGGSAMQLWGSGTTMESVNGYVHDMMFFGNSKKCQNPAVLVSPTRWGVVGATSPYKCQVENIRGVWLNGGGGPHGISIDASRASTTTVQNMDIRPPLANEVMLTVPKIYNADSEQALALQFLINFRKGDPKYTTAYVLQAGDVWLQSH